MMLHVLGMASSGYQLILTVHELDARVGKCLADYSLLVINLSRCTNESAYICRKALLLVGDLLLFRQKLGMLL